MTAKPSAKIKFKLRFSVNKSEKRRPEILDFLRLLKAFLGFATVSP